MVPVTIKDTHPSSFLTFGKGLGVPRVLTKRFIIVFVSHLQYGYAYTGVVTWMREALTAMLGGFCWILRLVNDEVKGCCGYVLSCVLSFRLFPTSVFTLRL